jgi:phospholipid transport system substrate-binding protein
MMKRRTYLRGCFALLLVASLSWALSTTSTRAESIEESAKAFLDTLSGDALQSLTVKDVPRPERIEKFRKLFNDYFAVKTIGRWVLGRNWRKATPEQQKEYLVLFEDLIVVSYVDRFAQYTGNGLKITKTLAHNEKVATVYSAIAQPNSTQPVRIDWRVGYRKTGNKILDVVVEGTSMSQTMRSDFGSIVRRNSGDIAGLINVLREKTTALKKEASAQ